MLTDSVNMEHMKNAIIILSLIRDFFKFCYYLYFHKKNSQQREQRNCILYSNEPGRMAFLQKVVRGSKFITFFNMAIG